MITEELEVRWPAEHDITTTAVLVPTGPGRSRCFRYALIREAADPALSTKQRGRLVRELAEREHTGPSGERVRVSRVTLDRWILTWRRGGFDALLPSTRNCDPTTAAAVLELAAALKREVPARTAAQVSAILQAHAGPGTSVPSARTLQRHFARLELNTRPDGLPPRAFGRFEAAAANDRWTGDALHGPVVAGRKTFLFAFVDDQTGTSPSAGGHTDLAQMNELFAAWVETVYHQRVHSETQHKPLERFLAAGPPTLPTPQLLREAFLWSHQRMVTKTATLSLHSNTYEVDAALIGRMVEVVFDPFDLTTLEVRYQGGRWGSRSRTGSVDTSTPTPAPTCHHQPRRPGSTTSAWSRSSTARSSPSGSTTPTYPAPTPWPATPLSNCSRPSWRPSPPSASSSPPASSPASST